MFNLISLLIALFSLPAFGARVYLPNYAERPIIEKLSQVPSENLVILLHAFKTSAGFMRHYYPLARQRDRFGFNLVIPSGSRNQKGQRYWSAGEACCDFYGDGADDLLFLDRLIDHYKKKLGVKKVYLIGHSNGAFLAHHYACYGNGSISGVFAFAGNPAEGLRNCRNLEGLRMLIAHGRHDGTVFYNGGTLRLGGGKVLPVESFIQDYRTALGCLELNLVSRANFTLSRIGKDFELFESAGCARGNALAFWRHFNGGHVPRFNARYLKQILEWLMDLGPGAHG